MTPMTDGLLPDGALEAAVGPMMGGIGPAIIEDALKRLVAAGWGLVSPQDHHVVEFTVDRWAIQHSVQCRVKGNLLDCDYQHALIADNQHGSEWDPGRYVIHLHPIPLVEVMRLQRFESDGAIGAIVHGLKADYERISS